MDESMPAALAVDENGLFDIDKRISKKLGAIKQAAKDQEIQSLREEAGITSDPTEKKPRFKPVDELLRILRIPEHWLIGAYYKSGLRKKLYEQYLWYREFEGAQEVNYRVENAYGGSTKPLDNAVHFIRNNVFTTLALSALVGHLFVGYLSQPALNRYADRSPPVSANNGAAIAASALAEKQVDEELIASLNHCTVSNDLRKIVDGQQDRDLKSYALAEISGFIQIYGDSDIEYWYTSRAAKRDMAISHIESTLPKIQNYSEQITMEMAQLVDQDTRIRDRLENIDVTTKPSINQFIRTRSELIKLDDQIRYNPSIMRAISVIDGQVLHLKKFVAGYNEADNSGISRWAVTTSQQELDSLTETIGEVVKNDVDANIVDLSLDSSETKLYRLQIISATLRDFGDLISHLGEKSNHTHIKVSASQNTSNKRLRDLLGLQGHTDVNFLNYDNCLSILNPASTKLTILQAHNPRAVPSS